MALPFPVEEDVQTADCNGPQCNIRSLLSEDLEKHADAMPHLMEYLHLVPIGDVGVPEFYDKPSKKLVDLEDKNLIYPISEELYVHILQDNEDARDYYIVIEPDMLEDMKKLVAAMDVRLLDYVEELSEAEDDDEKKMILTRAVDECCVVNKGSGSKGKGKAKGKAKSKGKGKGGGIFGFLSRGGSGHAPLSVTAGELKALKYTLVRDKLGMGVLEPVLCDPNIEDISCSGVGRLFIEHKIFNGLKSNIEFNNMDELDDFVLRMAERIGKPVTYRNPIVDATLLDGSRINIVYGSDVSRQGSNFTIRKFTSTPLSILDVIASGGSNYMMAAYLSLMVGEGLNIFVSGETASGKTTLLNALATFVPADAKIVSIEDTPEFQVPHKNWIREVIRGTMSSGDSAVGMFSLLKAALRQRPNLIVIGEIRGEEGAIAFQAMQTGHAVMATFHASTVEKLIQRMTGNPINVPKAYIDNLNVVVIMSMVRLPNGKTGRRIISISELVGYDKATDSFAFVEVFRWNSAEDEFEFTGNMSSYLLENTIAPKRGIPATKKREIYQELERRAAFLERLAEQGTNDFYDLYKVLAKAQRQGLL